LNPFNPWLRMLRMIFLANIDAVDAVDSALYSRAVLKQAIQLLVLLLALTTLGHAQAPLLINGVPIAQASGQDIYRATCAGCHGLDGKGQPESVRGFDVELPDFNECSFASPEAEADWIAVVANGGPIRAFDRKMPAFGDLLTLDQITKVVEYVRGLCSDESWPRGELNLPRALATEKAFPENEALVTTTLARGPGSMSNKFLYEHRIGARSQYEIVVPFNLQRRDAPAGWNRGLGDIELALKRVMFHSSKSGSIFSLGTELVLPTGKETQALGGGRTVIEPFAAFGQILPRDGFLQFQGGFERPITRQEASTEGFWRTAIGKTFTQGWGRAWSPMLEVLGAREFESGARAEWDVIPQLQVTLSTRQHIILNAGFRFPVNDTYERNKTFMVYLLWDWFDGGLFSGW
jgi:mono/diheme cytochrome c family protein